jgi:hypothetical protein
MICIQSIFALSYWFLMSLAYWLFNVSSVVGILCVFRLVLMLLAMLILLFERLVGLSFLLIVVALLVVSLSLKRGGGTVVLLESGNLIVS